MGRLTQGLIGCHQLSLLPALSVSLSPLSSLILSLPPHVFNKQPSSVQPGKICQQQGPRAPGLAAVHEDMQNPSPPAVAAKDTEEL